MIYSNITNVVHSIVSPTMNILYSSHNSLFDCLFKQLNYNIYGYNDVVSSYYYDVLISNNFLSYHGELGAFSNKFHIKNCLLFHDNPPPTFKKEDITLANQNTSKIHRIVFGSELANTWRLQNSRMTSVIEYGCPTFEQAHDRNKSVIIINLDNNPNVNMLYQHIKNHIPDCEMLNDLSMSWSLQDIYNLLSQYKICVDLSHTINSIVAACCGCQCITSQMAPKNKLISYVTDYGNIINIIQILLSMNLSEEERTTHKTLLAQMFDYNKFIDKLSIIINSLKEQGFVLYE